MADVDPALTWASAVQWCSAPRCHWHLVALSSVQLALQPLLHETVSGVACRHGRSTNRLMLVDSKQGQQGVCRSRVACRHGRSTNRLMLVDSKQGQQGVCRSRSGLRHNLGEEHTWSCEDTSAAASCCLILSFRHTISPCTVQHSRGNQHGLLGTAGWKCEVREGPMVAACHIGRQAGSP